MALLAVQAMESWVGSGCKRWKAGWGLGASDGKLGGVWVQAMESWVGSGCKRWKAGWGLGASNESWWGLGASDGKLGGVWVQAMESWVGSGCKRWKAGWGLGTSDGKLGGAWVQAMEGWVGPGNGGTLMGLGSAVLTQQSLEIKLISSAPAATSALITEQPIGKYQISEFSIKIAQVHGTEFSHLATISMCNQLKHFSIKREFMVAALQL